MPARRPVDPASGRAALEALRAQAPQGTADRADLRVATRWLLEELSRRAPGSSVEVRVPPFAAVQAVAGPVHRRGTPAAVVEMDAETWLALATGELGWAEAQSTGRIRASGARADLSALLPLVP
jgi:hypothetical protein